MFWIQHAQRASHNPALDLAIATANELDVPAVALFVLRHDFPGANLRHYHFMMQGLVELPAALAARGVGFVLRVGGQDEVARFCAEVKASAVVGDENPLREAEAWRARVAAALRVPFWTVDADVIVPAALLEKEQFSAGTIRPRIERQLPWCLRLPSRPVARRPWMRPRGVRVESPGLALLDGAAIDRRVAPVPGAAGGARAARAALRAFVRGRLEGYASARNHPEVDGTSRLSAYLHFGQIGPREVALAVRDAGAPLEDRQAFLEEFVVRRELAWNFVRFNPRYDSLEGCEPWARRTLNEHRDDPRAPVYTLEELEQAGTHDPLWNAAQRQMVRAGWMHGYVRMYWAKKILEWSPAPEEAMARAIELNDRYELDGRDPNGYAGIAWAIGGKHDRAWGPERPVYGKIRYMSFASTSRKFDSRSYMEQWGE
ncbi:MAG: deoxyribodipyrimidine photolyase [Acidobacteria bacterium]|nr:MAG: deoxyribodipyrimidine photolyase [Acidobacteriota bacterium]